MRIKLIRVWTDPNADQAGPHLAPKRVANKTQIQVGHPSGSNPNVDQRVDSYFAASFNFEPNFKGVINRIKRHIIYESYKKK